MQLENHVKWYSTRQTVIQKNVNIDNNQEIIANIKFNNFDSDTNAKSNWYWSESQSDDNTSIASIPRSISMNSTNQSIISTNQIIISTNQSTTISTKREKKLTLVFILHF